MPLLLLASATLFGQMHPLQELIEAARTNSPRLKDLIASGLPQLEGRDGAAVWGQDFLFAVEAASPATVMIDHQPAISMTNIPGTKYWYRLMTLRLGVTHNFNYFADGKSLGTYDVAGYNPDSYPLPGVPHGQISAMKTLQSKVYPGMSSNYWVYVNPGADMVNGAPLMVWQDGEAIYGKLDLLRLRLQIVSDNLVAKKLIPPMVHVLIQPGSGGEATGTRMRSILYDTVSDRYGKYLMDEVLADVEKTYKLRHDAWSRAISGPLPERFARLMWPGITRTSSAASCRTSAVTWRCSGIRSKVWTAATSSARKYAANRRKTSGSGFPTARTIRKRTPEAGR